MAEQPKNASERSRKWRKEHPGRLRDCVLKHLYGITLEQYNQMFQEQEGRCAICGRHQGEFKRSLNVDHDHKTNKVRGLLCTDYNRNLGITENWAIKHKVSIQRYLDEL